MIKKLAFLNYSQLSRAASIVGANKTRLVKGGICTYLPADSLLREIRRSSASTSKDRVSRLYDYLENINIPSTCSLNEKYLWDKDPKDTTRLKEQIINLCESMSVQSLHEMVNQWITEPKNEDCSDYEEFDYSCEELGWQYIEDECEDLVLAAPSFLAFEEKVIDDFKKKYDAFVKIASYGSGIKLDPPSMTCPGNEFLTVLVQILKFKRTQELC